MDELGWESEHWVSQTGGPETTATVEGVFAAEAVCGEIGPEPNEKRVAAVGAGTVGAVEAWL